jgi:opacity protein-like surface antigen
MNRFIAILIAFLPGLAEASMNGWLAGIQLGHYNSDYTPAGLNYTTFNGSPLGLAIVQENEGHFSGRTFLGYSFNEYLEAELGYTRYEPVKFDNIYGVANAQATLHLETSDLVGKVKLPLTDFLSLYGKLGAAHVKKDASYNKVAKRISVSGAPLVLPANDDAIYRTTYGLGAIYDLNTTFSVELGWSHIDGQGQLQAIDFGFIGIVYYFDQFLT